MPFEALPARSPLGRHRQLAPNAAVKVSPLCLGAMSFGVKNKDDLGECNKDTSFGILDRFVALGGNFVDTANSYQHEESEEWLGEWMESRKNRDQMVLATKFSSGWKAYKGDVLIQANYGGNNAKSLKLSVEDSMRKLKTSYIDVLYVHWWDYTTSIPELMTSLNDLVSAGKVLYLGISDTPAWIVSMANQYARDHGMRQFVAYQGLWNAATRDMERDIMPMCRNQGMAVVNWGAIGQGRFQTEKAFEEREKHNPGRKGKPISESDRKVSKVLDAIANAKASSIHAIALAYCLAKQPYVFPLIGCRTMEHLEGNVTALTVSLNDDDIRHIDAASGINFGFPHTFLLDVIDDPTEGASRDSEVWLTKMMGTFDWVDELKAIKPFPS